MNVSTYLLWYDEYKEYPHAFYGIMYIKSISLTTGKDISPAGGKLPAHALL